MRICVYFIVLLLKNIDFINFSKIRITTDMRIKYVCKYALSHAFYALKTLILQYLYAYTLLLLHSYFYINSSKTSCFFTCF